MLSASGGGIFDAILGQNVSDLTLEDGVHAISLVEAECSALSS